jgi:hypothetical protein
VIIASAWSNPDAEGRTIQLQVQCRRGRTDVVIVSSALGGAHDAKVSYSVDDAPPIPLPAAPAPAGNGIAIKSDVVRFVMALPPRGEVVFHVVSPQVAPLDGRYALPAFSAVLDRLAGPCKWPARTR